MAEGDELGAWSTRKDEHEVDRAHWPDQERQNTVPRVAGGNVIRAARVCRWPNACHFQVLVQAR